MSAILMTPPHDLIAKFVEGTAGVEAFVVLSSIEIEIARRHPKRHQFSKRQLDHRMSSCPDARDLCKAAELSGLDAARELAKAFMQTPQMIWWCHSNIELEQAITQVYERFDAAMLHDGYEFGSCGQLGWIAIWRD